MPRGAEAQRRHRHIQALVRRKKYLVAKLEAGDHSVGATGFLAAEASALEWVLEKLGVEAENSVHKVASDVGGEEIFMGHLAQKIVGSTDHSLPRPTYEYAVCFDRDVSKLQGQWHHESELGSLFQLVRTGHRIYRRQVFDPSEISFEQMAADLRERH
jgi:hypothetical protein